MTSRHPADGPADELVSRLDRTAVGGDVDIDLGAAIERFGLVDLACETRCGSGEPIEGHWRGIELVEVLGDIDPDATHLLVESEDGFRVCVPVADAVEGILAVDRLDTEFSPEGLPRLVSPSLSGTRLVRRVATIEGTRLSGSADPAAYEELLPGETPRTERP
ncbi:molybdopterin-dependent oxidoreductase [Natronomonas sp. LN261]|jgi:DMSO/TMAO reductase YedYZ molybdopterin-dependent catalytic subunit|uniref:molybdopterin-dependent oxidoreductase n=1 Tax=Natronomonas sp. LN261 TaxID=2750669 RepID=UPI0015EF95CB|nr:molybdopterin-dependent oxidoreductase [Natronomonas sp. LN261]